ncbi:inositol monophosphatase family protein [Arcobacter porcinus]|uniref:inositol monophosphatase family protein n=1 Tax=Arcobacter porcinus TaxID=1935204 RepID=UPI000825DD47|nr:inositol monophosphatase family protein [Arcobacter porcinus]OCL85830.1 Inositol-1-monophosphatase [Arcobacter porcinus]
MIYNLEKLTNSIKEANIEVFEYFTNKLSKDDFLFSSQIGFGGDNSLNADIVFENIFIKHLEKYGNILSEECGFIDKQKDITFVIDPLDGSNNFYSDLPYFGTSIAIRYKDEVIAGFVANLANKTMVYRVANDEIKYFSLDKKEKFIRVSNDKSKVGVFERGYKYPEICKFLNDKRFKFRILGATALSLANAKDYDFVLFIGDLREFDLEAGLFISSDLYIYKDENLVFVTKKENFYYDFKESIKQFLDITP